jgi:hypothetical protein
VSLVLLESDDLKRLIQEAVRDALADHASTPKADTPELVSGAAMARALSVSRATMHRMRLRGCPAVKLGDSWKYRPVRVLAWVETHGANPQ